MKNLVNNWMFRQALSMTNTLRYTKRIRCLNLRKNNRVLLPVYFCHGTYLTNRNKITKNPASITIEVGFKYKLLPFFIS